MAQLLEYVKMALMNIRSNKGRSFLTMLGIIIGISSVIMIISIGNGVSSEISGDLNDMAGGQIYMYTQKNDEYEAVKFTESDFTMIQDKIKHVKGVTASYSSQGTALGAKGDFQAYLYGGNEALEYVVSSDKIVKGQYFTKADAESGARVCVITEASAIAMFGTTDVIGKSFEVTVYNQTVELTIVGIRANNTSKMLAMVNGSPDVQVEMPIRTFNTGFGYYVEDFDGFYIVSESAEYSKEVAASALSLMESKHNVRSQNVIKLEKFDDYMKTINSVLGTITIFIVFVAAISLLVGGIGVMNIMLVSVTERTREIGIRKALGARTGSIMLQFLSESAIITLIGGVIGILIGTLGAVLICAVIGFHAQISPAIVLLATLFSSGVGIFFGIYPAKRAAKLSPIEALRHE